MEPKIVERSAFTVVGMHYYGQNENNEIPQMWQEFGPRIQEIEHVVNPHVAYGISDNMDEETGEFDYVAGFEVSNAADIPEGMVSWEVPAGTYAVFTTTLPRIGETFQHAYRTWMPEAGRQPTSGPDFELYDENFDPQDPNSEFEVCVPIKEA
ncbi:MAG: GyrI-like domain-containing protein [Anaerolineae bacterium]